MLARTILCNRKVWVLIGALILALSLPAWRMGLAWAARTAVTRITENTVASELRVGVAATGPISYHLRDIRSDWIVLDIPNAELRMSNQLPVPYDPVKKLRAGQFTSDTVRVVIELAHPIRYHLIASYDKSIVLIRIPVTPEERASVNCVVGQPTGAAPRAKGNTTLHAVPTSAVPGHDSMNVGPYSIVPGRGIGDINLGMPIRDISGLKGPSWGTAPTPDGSTIYRWFGPPENVGVGIRVTPAGAAYRIWVVNNPSYATREGLHAGSTEEEVRTALGEPSRAFTTPDTKIKTLVYDSRGVWFGIQLDEQHTLYNRVFEIGVMEAKQ